jgi:energy-coupling factor transport system ATP-binding protein
MASSDGLAIHELCFQYPPLDAIPAATVLEGASFLLPAGKAGAILGAADAGKTTLLRLLAGLVPRFTGGKVSGSAAYGGLNLLGTLPYEAMEKVGLVFQDPDEQIITTRCDSEVAFALESLGISGTDMETRIAPSLRLMGLESFAGRNPGTLSGGEKKRLLIACLAAADPELWLLDEVFQELDHEWRTALLGQVRERGRTALFLDSRWSPLYGPECTAVSVLCKGTLMPSQGTGKHGDLLVSEGLVLGPDSEALDPSVPAEAEPGNPRIRMEGVEFAFPGAGAFSLSIDELSLGGQGITAIVGRNGSGKSTLGRVLCGLLVPSRGRIMLRVGGRFVPSPPEMLRRRVGFLFQNPDYQVFLPTVGEELAFGLRSSRLGARERKEKIEDAIRLFRLPSAATPPSLMSYGARRRLQAGTFHALERDVLILDEVDSGLAYGDILGLLPILGAKDRGIVLVTHDLALARHVAARIVVMERGRVVEDQAAREFSGVPVI